MAQALQSPPSSIRLRWPTALVSALGCFAVAVVVQPVVKPLMLELLAILPVVLALLVGVRYLRRWGNITSIAVGLVAAALAYVVLYVIAAPTGFPSSTFGSPAAPIIEVFGHSGSNRLEVGVGTCNQDPHVTAEESADEVRLSSNEKIPRGDKADCADGDEVTLDMPLGDRTVIDEATGKLLEVLPGETCVEDPLQPEC